MLEVINDPARSLGFESSILSRVESNGSTLVEVKEDWLSKM